jgi:TRAP-type transport system small permease protein
MSGVTERAGDEEPDDRSFLAEIEPEGIVGVFLMAAILVIMTLGVFFRYVLNDSLTWSEELARYGLVYATFIGGAVAARRRSHIRVTFLENLLPQSLTRWLERLQDLVTLVFAVYVAWLAIQISGILSSTRSAAMHLPMHYVYAAIVIGFGLMAMRLAVGLWRGWRS